MHDHWDDAIHGFERLNVAVIGDSMLDQYSSGTSMRLAPEGPVPVVDVQSTQEFVGGAANTAANLAALGANVALVSLVGDDAEGRRLRQLLSIQRVDTADLVVEQRRSTLCKHRIMAGSQLLVRYDRGSTDLDNPATETRLLDAVDRTLGWADVLVLSDYGFGVVSPAMTALLRSWRKRGPTALVIDSKKPAAFRALAPTAVKPNYAQSIKLLNLPPLAGSSRREQLIAHGAELLDQVGANLAAVTLDEDGSLLLEQGRPPQLIEARRVRSAQVAGAGDTYLAALALGLGLQIDPVDACQLASAAAQIAISKPHTAVCTGAELLSAVAAPCPHDWSALSQRLVAYRAAGQKIVLTSGCFDILHAGHVSYLRAAKELGDVLVVGVNTDASIRALKGPSRPVNPLEDRIAVLAALGCIDEVVAFGEATPERLIRTVCPDIFVKGGDYTIASLPEAPLVAKLGGRVVILPFLGGHSTTRMIEKIRQAELAAAERVAS